MIGQPLEKKEVGQMDPGIYMVDQDPRLIAENKSVLAELSMLPISRHSEVSWDPRWTDRLRKEGMGR